MARVEPLFRDESVKILNDWSALAYVSDESGTQEVYVRRYPDLDAPRQASIGGGGQPQWRADQRELFYLSPDRYVMAATVIGTRDLSFETARRLFRTSIAEGPSAARDSYAAMPDGRSFLIDARRDASIEPITVLLHWATGLTSAPLPQLWHREPTQVANRKTR